MALLSIPHVEKKIVLVSSGAVMYYPTDDKTNEYK